MLSRHLRTLNSMTTTSTTLSVLVHIERLRILSRCYTPALALADSSFMTYATRKTTALFLLTCTTTTITATTPSPQLWKHVVRTGQNNAGFWRGVTHPICHRVDMSYARFAPCPLCHNPDMSQQTAPYAQGSWCHGNVLFVHHSHSVTRSDMSQACSEHADRERDRERQRRRHRQKERMAKVFGRYVQNTENMSVMISPLKNCALFGPASMLSA